LFFDDFLGGATAGVSSGATFSSSTAVFDTNDDGIEHLPELFPAAGSVLLRLRIDEIGAVNAVAAGGTSPWSVILDSAGADSRTTGDLFWVVNADGTVSFSLRQFGAPDETPLNQIQVTSSSSILDGEYHTVGISYGPAGIKLAIDGVIEDSDPSSGLRNTTKAVSLGDFTDRGFPDASFAFGFVGEVDWILVSDDFESPPPDPIPEPATVVVLAIAFGVIAWRRTIAGSTAARASRNPASTGSTRTPGTP
jgi:hypothetical protein